MVSRWPLFDLRPRGIVLLRVGFLASTGQTWSDNDASDHVSSFESGLGGWKPYVLCCTSRNPSLLPKPLRSKWSPVTPGKENSYKNKMIHLELTAVRCPGLGRIRWAGFIIPKEIDVFISLTIAGNALCGSLPFRGQESISFGRVTVSVMLRQTGTSGHWGLACQRLHYVMPRLARSKTTQETDFADGNPRLCLHVSHYVRP